MTRIANKKQMYQQLLAGAFGNYMQVWHSVEEVLASGYTGEVSIRSLQTSDPIRLYHVRFAKLVQTVAELPLRHKESGLTFCESPNDRRRTIQGELMQGLQGLYLHYSREPVPMRFALEMFGKHAEGLTAKLLLQRHLAASDYEWLLELLDTYPGHVLEFTGFSCRVGVLHQKMVVWEVRAYAVLPWLIGFCVIIGA